MQSYSSGIRIGLLDQNPIRNVNFINCNITNSSRGIGVFLRDEGSIENLTLTKVHIETRLYTGDWWDNGEPVHISAIRGKEGVRLGHIKNVTFTNVSCKAENGILLYGTDESVLEDITFNGLKMEFADSPLNDVAGGNVDLRGNSDPKFGLFARDITAFLAEHVNGLTINDFKVEWTDPRASFLTNGIEINHFKNVRIANFTGTGAPNNPAARPVVLSDGTNAAVDLQRNLVVRKNVH